jgi:IS5 family transposase
LVRKLCTASAARRFPLSSNAAQSTSEDLLNLSDPQAEDYLCGIELFGHDIPDVSMILRFRHLLEGHEFTQRIFAESRSLLEGKRLLLKFGTIVDATIIAAPPSTENEQGARAAFALANLYLLRRRLLPPQ